MSILIPIYNHAPYIKACLDSIASCGYSNLEVIAIDDGSTDDSFRIAEEWACTNSGHFKNITLLTKKNEGVVKTLNLLIEKSNGEYITLLASDDMLMPQGIERRLQVFANDKDCYAVFGDCQVISKSGDVLYESALTGYKNADKLALSDCRFIATELILRWNVPGPGFMARRELYDENKGVGLYTEGLVIEDRDYYLRVVYRGWLRYVDCAVAKYRLHETNAIGLLNARAATDFVRTECEAARRFGGLNRVVLKLRCFYYRLKVVRRSRGTGWLLVVPGEALIFAVLYLIGLAFSAYVRTRKFADTDKAAQEIG